ncbi:protein WVD2-like 4 isoform X2 [Primulina tabacum]|uniref:protein WVD2-like 4 isoform X2 n=1 Tax=Primulina tabacum TaxID=48773 RepID=UPI003F59ED92
METESVFHIEDEKEVIFQGEDSTVDLNNEITSSSEPNDQVTKEKQHGCIISAADVETLDTKSPNTIKGSKNDDLNTNKLDKNLSNSKGTAVFGRNMKPGLSKSLSFPARGRHSDVMKRSIELHPVKTDARQNHKNGPKVESKYSKVDSSSGSSLNSSEKVSSPKAAGRRTTLPSSSSLRQSISVKHASANGTAPNFAPEVLIEKSAESGSNVSLPAKEDDAQSTTSSNATPRSQKNIIPIFRLEERAEKRKEFLSKIEEKIHAKEVEKSNLQARSKEYQEAEIKQLRKSLTFKATPMPSFYKEPPAKVELKKLPTTRPISPKLGRNKGIASMSSNTHDNGGLHRGDAKSQKVPLRNSEMGNAILKKSIKNSIAKSQSRESLTPRKVKLAEKEELEETQNRPHCIVESLEEPIQEGGEVYR